MLIYLDLPYVATSILSVPTITSDSNFHAFEGGELLLNCSEEIEVGVKAQLKWELPSGNKAFEVI